jgi:hypothetical protein
MGIVKETFVPASAPVSEKISSIFTSDFPFDNDPTICNCSWLITFSDKKFIAKKLPV